MRRYRVFLAVRRCSKDCKQHCPARTGRRTRVVVAQKTKEPDRSLRGEEFFRHREIRFRARSAALPTELVFCRKARTFLLMYYSLREILLINRSIPPHQ